MLHAPIILAALIGGALIAAQGPIYARMAIELGSAVTAALIAFLLATFAVAALAVSTRVPLPTWPQLVAAPKWIWLGALVGVYQVLVSITAVPKLGVGAFILIVVFGQIVASQVYDHFGWFGLVQRSMDIKSCFGIGCMMAGLALVFWR